MVLSMFHIVEGRRPEGFSAPKPRTDVSELGDYFARAAYHDVASANAFLRLGRELEEHGAPACLVDGCVAAHRAELRHAESLGDLAEDYGVFCDGPPSLVMSVRPIVAVALENVVEGLVRETYGAVVATLRARSAGKAKIRRVMKSIARDEQVHARLAIGIAAWFSKNLTETENVWLDNAMRHAARSLSREVDVETAGDLSWKVGVPSRHDANAICTGLLARVWIPRADQQVWTAVDDSAFGRVAA
jgi:hypothetical protein